MGRSFGALQFINRGFRDEAIEVLEIAGLLVTPSRKNATANLRKGAKPLRHVKAARHRRGGKGEPGARAPEMEGPGTGDGRSGSNRRVTGIGMPTGRGGGTG